jgi:hypothetical protein
MKYTQITATLPNGATTDKITITAGAANLTSVKRLLHYPLLPVSVSIVQLITDNIIYNGQRLANLYSYSVLMEVLLYQWR